MDIQLIALIGLLFLSAFLSGAEIALISVPESKIHPLLEKGGSTAKVLHKLKQNPQGFIITILIALNIVNVGVSVLTAVWAAEKFGNHFLALATGLLTFVIIIFCELFPKIYAERFSLHLALFVARPIYLLQILLFPCVWLLEKMMHFLVGKESRDKITEDEIKALLYMSAEKGTIEHEERELISNVLSFSDTRAGAVMTPREKIASLDGSTNINEAVQFFVEEGFSRVPVYAGDVDNVQGILTIQELLRAKKNRDSQTKIIDLDLNQPILIPESKLLDDLFKEFQWKHQHMAIVVNEHGSVVGVVTMEDLLEEIVGEIVDESDTDEILIEKLSQNSWRVNSEVSVEELNETLGTEFPCEEHKTVSYLLLETFQKIPRRGEDILISGFHFFIEKMTGNKIDSVRVMKVEVTDEE